MHWRCSAHSRWHGGRRTARRPCRSAVASVSGPQEERREQEASGGGDSYPGNAGRRTAEILLLRGTDMFGAWKLQLGEFFDIDRRRDFNFRLERLSRRFARYDRRVWATTLGRVPSVMRVYLRLPQAREVVVDGILGIEAEVLGVCADKSFIEDSAGKQVEVFLFDRLQHARADLGYIGNVVEREFSLLARFTEFFAKLAHVVRTLRVVLATS